MHLSNQPPAHQSFARSAAFVMAARWADRLIGIASTLILARLLLPEDFGIVAMASLIVVLIDTLLDLGVNAALVQNRQADAEDFSSAWTVRLIQSALVAALIVAGAPLVADYFHDARVVPVLWVMAATILAGAGENIGIVAFQKRMEFDREFRFVFARRVVGFVATIAFALWLRSYWAMVVGALIGRCFGVWLSYAMHEFRPRLSLRRLGSIWSFSQWILVRNIGSYGAQEIDKFVVGRRQGASSLGAYTLADEIAAMPTGELLMPLGRLLFPAFVRVADHPLRLQKAFSLALGVQALVALPAGVGLALVAETAVPLLLGPQWRGAIPLVQALALMNIALALTHSSIYLLLALGKVRLQAAFAWMQLATLGLLLLAVFPTADVQGVAHIRLATSIAGMFLFLLLVLRAIPALRLHHLIAYTWRPLAASAAMAATLAWLPLPDGLPPAIRLLAEVGCGGVAYTLSLLLLWRLAKGRRSAETYLLHLLRLEKRLKALRPALPGQHAGPVTSAARPDELPAAARELLAAAGRTNPELGPEWFDNLQRSVFADDPGVRYYARLGDAGCRAVLPLRLARRGPVRVVESLSNYYTSLYAPPLGPAAGAADLAPLLHRASADHSRAHEMRFAPMAPGSPAYAALVAALRACGWIPFTFFCHGNWHTRIESDWETYLAGRPGQVRSTLKRMQKKFAAAGGTLKIVHGGDELDAAIESFIAVYDASWKQPEPYPQFIPGLIRLLAASGSLRLGLACLGGRPVAAQLWAVRGGRCAIIKLAHRQDSDEFAPGTLLTAALMQHVITTDGVDEIDYLIGDDPYKRNWMDQRRERHGIVAYNPRTATGLALLLREVAGRSLKALQRRGGRIDANDV